MQCHRLTECLTKLPAQTVPPTEKNCLLLSFLFSIVLSLCSVLKTITKKPLQLARLTLDALNLLASSQCDMSVEVAAKE